MSYKNLWKELQYDTIYFENLFRKIELMHPDKIAKQ